MVHRRRIADAGRVFAVRSLVAVRSLPHEYSFAGRREYRSVRAATDCVRIPGEGQSEKVYNI